LLLERRKVCVQFAATGGEHDLATATIEVARFEERLIGRRYFHERRCIMLRDGPLDIRQAGSTRSDLALALQNKVGQAKSENQQNDNEKKFHLRARGGSSHSDQEGG